MANIILSTVLLVAGLVVTLIALGLLLYPQVVWECTGECCVIGYRSAYESVGLLALLLGVVMMVLGYSVRGLSW